MTDNEITPTQADRDAAADYLKAQHPMVWPANRRIRLRRFGEHDLHPLVQAFARHRLASTLPAPEPSEVGELIERLRRKVQVMPPIGGGSISADGTSTCYITDDGKRLVNPDGPEAADTLATMQERVGVLEGTLRHIADLTHRQQLPITAEINELATDALSSPTQSGEG